MEKLSQNKPPKPRLFDLVHQKIQALHYSRWVEKTYIGCIRPTIDEMPSASNKGH